MRGGVSGVIVIGVGVIGVQHTQYKKSSAAGCTLNRRRRSR